MGDRYDRQKRIPGWDQEELKGKKVAIIGAGSLGTFVALELAMLGVGEIRIYDNDLVEEVNLNRQFLYHDAIGQPKARTLAEKLSEINEEVTVKPYGLQINKTTVKMIGEADLIFDCLDNLVTRAVINEYCVEKKIPLVSGATSPMEGQVAQYIPGRTPCLDCQLDLYKEAEREAERMSCNHQPNASVVMTNAIIASIMVEEGRQILMPLEGDQLMKGFMRYNGQLKEEFAYINAQKKKECKC